MTKRLAEFIGLNATASAWLVSNSAVMQTAKNVIRDGNNQQLDLRVWLVSAIIYNETLQLQTLNPKELIFTRIEKFDGSVAIGTWTETVLAEGALNSPLYDIINGVIYVS